MEESENTTRQAEAAKQQRTVEQLQKQIRREEEKQRKTFEREQKKQQKR
jgi:hypothetical protein